MEQTKVAFSVIVPVYNRPQEMEEFLQSLTRQNFSDFEVLIVEDGSTVPCRMVAETYADQLNLNYFDKPNSGPGQSRNYGAERSNGDYLLFFDSDVILPEHYLQTVADFLQHNPVDAFGGPDRAHESFTDIQKAINYAMTSFFTTGGIRGGKKKLDKFFPRSFNMGIKRTVYQELDGFRSMRFGEDVDFSYRIVETGHSTALIADAFVYHKRRTDLMKFFRQVHNSGRARINLSILHPGTLKIVHLLPAAFTIGVALLLVGGVWWHWLWYLLLCYVALIFVDATTQTKSVKIGCLAVAASFTQLMGYGTGFIVAAFRRYILRKDNRDAFNDTFYK